jgi:asparagine synthase (glutamine-hydrolysing)
MCGIVLVISKNPTPPEILKKMNDSLIHRGPDGEGFFIDSQIAMSHRRLSIVDLSNAGAQPMHYMNRYIIVFNGEIYNYIELRDELIQLGYKFQSKTDTEVIMASFAQWGKDCIKRFNGMWAFAIYDREDQKVFISRDRFGIKPLYYYKDENILVFSSEIKAILKHNLIKKEYN